MTLVSNVARNLLGRREGPAGFDPAFYRKRYADLRGIPTTSKLLEHYFQHGKREGRFVSLEDARERLSQMGRRLPADFRADFYARANPDLREAFDEEWEYELHYLEFGQDTGRPYLGHAPGASNSTSSSSLQEFDSNFYTNYYHDLLNHDRQAATDHFLAYGKSEGRYKNLRDAIDGLKRTGYVLPSDFDASVYIQINPTINPSLKEPWQIDLHYALNGERMGLPHKAVASLDVSNKWKDIFVSYDFCLYHGEKSALDHKAALRVFEHEGIDRLTPIARDWYFDPQFYRLNYNIKLKNDVELYRHWLQIGLPLEQAPNENRAVVALVGEQSFYPEAFDWRSYSSAHWNADSQYPAKIASLVELFEEPLNEKATKSIKGVGAGDLYAKIGDYYLVREDYATAFGCYDQIPDSNMTSAVLTRKGDALKGLGRNSDAITAYGRAISFRSYPIWALIHYTKMSIATGNPLAAFEMLEKERSRWAGNPLYRSAVDECIELRFTQISEAAWKLVIAGDVGCAHQHVDSTLPQLTDAIHRLKTSQTLTTNFQADRVLILACLDLPQCTHYRIDQKAQQLRSLGYDVEIFDQNSPQEFISSLPGSSAAIFYRVPSYPKIIEAILYTRALGITTFYDIDDLIFTSDFPEDFQSYEDQISYEVFASLNHGVPYYRHAISLCDIGLASTGPLAARLRPLVRFQKTYVIANGLAQETTELIDLLTRKPGPGDGTLRIFYGSGTKAHNRDFNVLLGPALIHVLETYPHVHLIIVGYLGLDAKFDQFKGRICRINFIGDRSEYLALLASCDINLSVLSSGAIADCKSEIKWLEASIFKVPTVASPTQTLKEVLHPPHDGLFAQTQADWVELLSRLIEDRQLRENIGIAAHRRAVEKYNMKKIGGDLVAALSNHLPQSCDVFGPTHNRLPHVLICNVFFAPQSIGGATRVVESNLDYFIDNVSAELTFSVLATDDGMSPGSFRIDTYRGITVYRIATAYGLNMDWRPFNDDNVLIYRKILAMDKPDIVHFHCIQRLTASLVQETLDQDIPYVVTAHDAWWISDHQFLFDDVNFSVVRAENLFGEALPQGVTRSQSVFRRQRLGALLNSARYTLAVSETFGDIYRKAGIQNVRTVANGIGLLPTKLPLCTRPDKLVLGHIGGRSAHKGAALLEIVLRQNAFENLELIMIDGRIEPGQEIRTQWGRTAVFLKGYYSQDRINELYASFDVLVAPSIWPESFGLVAREGSFYGKWIVTSDMGAIGEDVVDGVNGFVVDVQGTDALKRVLQRFDDEPSHFKKEVHRMELRSSDDQARDLVGIYHSIVSSRSSVVRQTEPVSPPPPETLEGR